MAPMAGTSHAQKFVEGCYIDWDEVARDSYLRGIPALTNMGQLAFTHQVTFLAGENGTGKSTLLEALAVAYGFNAEGGTLNYDFSTYDDVSDLERAIRLSYGLRKRNSGYFFRAESFFNVATAEERLYSDAFHPSRKYHERSHGESFLDYMQSDSREGLYLLDEPEAALSQQRQLTLLLYLHQMAANGSQFIIATHSPILLGLPEAQILEFTNSGITPVAYEDTESYQITRLFLDDREGLLRRLFQE